MTTSTSAKTPKLIANFDNTKTNPIHNGRTYTDAQLLSQLVACAERLGSSPTIDEFNSDPNTHAHAQTIVSRFGSWNAAKRKAGLSVQRFATDQELLDPLRDLARRLGHVPTPSEIDEARPLTVSRTTYAAHFGSLRLALKAAGLAVATNVDEHLDMAIADGVKVATRLGRVPTMTEWAKLRAQGATLPSEWQIYRLCRNETSSPWDVFRALVERAMQSGS